MAIFGLWPLRMCPFPSMTVTVMIHVFIDTFHEAGGQIGVSGIKKVHCVSWWMQNIPNTHGIENV